MPSEEPAGGFVDGPHPVDAVDSEQRNRHFVDQRLPEPRLRRMLLLFVVELANGGIQRVAQGLEA